VKKLGYLLLIPIAGIMAAIFAIAIYATLHAEENVDPPDVAARKAECRKLQDHLISITPDAHKVVSIEDIEQCAAADKDKTGVDRKPAVIACLQNARDQAAVRACIPPAAAD
jgi:hypothetical protein